MRTIKFRAKAIVNQKWAGIKKGDFVHGSFIQSGVDAPCIIFGDGDQVEIDIKTLGQYIGIKTNGNEIYEGDTLRISYDGEEPGLHNVEWGGDHYPAFALPLFDSECNSFAEIVCSGDYSMEIVGTIHDKESK